jgi:aminoglycoside phosphotransferase family enzyme/predicted kinase
VARADLPPVIQALLRSDAYSHPTGKIELIQTHVSYVLLAGEHVYKIKKPVDFGFLDYSTLGKRRYNCRQEVILNSRLCSDTYLGVVAIRETAEGLRVGGKGKIVEYAVHMRRLPEERMMHRLLEAGKVTPAMLRRVADKVAEFHAKAETSKRIAEYGGWAIKYAWDENIEQWTPYIGQTVTAEQDRILTAYGEAFFARNRRLLARRVKERRIRDGHSDLRSDAVCIENGICIMDCVEFNRRIRWVDVTRDVGFLAMDLDYRGRPELGRAFVRRYVKTSGDTGVDDLIDFYKAYNACVRGKVDGFQLSQPEIPTAARRAAQKSARRYFELACEYAQSLPPAMLVITCGLPATGKSVIARSVADAAGMAYYSSDIVRKELQGLAPTERRFERYDTGIYSPEFHERTYAALLDRARADLEVGRSVVLDASYIRRDHRKASAALARETGAQFAVLHTTADESLVRQRLEERLRSGADPSDARWVIYTGQKRRFQRPTEVEEMRLIEIDSSKPSRTKLKRALDGLRRISPLSIR